MKLKWKLYELIYVTWPNCIWHIGGSVMDDYEDNKSKTCREGPKHFIRISKWDTNRNSLKSQMTLSIRSMIFVVL